MANAGTVTIEEKGHRDGLLLKTIEWLADSSGDAILTTAEIEGTIERIVFDPDPTSDLQPDNLYDVTCIDENGVDVFTAKGENLGEASTVSVLQTGGDGAVLPFATVGKLVFTVDNAGAGNAGVVRVYLRR